VAIGGPKSDGGDEEGIFADINITPLTDIFLVLLIIFMVTSSVMNSDAGARAGVKVNLPRGATKEIATNARDITVAITTDGKMVVDGKEMSADTMQKIFEAAKAKDPETQVIVQADEATHHGRVVAVMELAKAAGLRRLAIATRRAR
jgi:biopolymer transport protein ExbD